MKVKFDFSGWATKNNIKCSDGRTIMKDAFKHNHGITVPLVWQHQHGTVENILGHAVLENKEDGVYAYCLFNDTEAGVNAKKIVQHKDVKALSIFANNLKQQVMNVMHGDIKEVSLVLSGANPGALIDNVMMHAEGSTTDYVVNPEVAVIYNDCDLSLMHGEADVADSIEHAAGAPDETMAEVFDTLDEKQKNVVYAMLAQVAGNQTLEQSGIDNPAQQSTGGLITVNQAHGGGKVVKNNIFDKTEEALQHGGIGSKLTHADFASILAVAKKSGSLKDAMLSNEKVIAHAGTYGIDNIGVLFPDAKTVTDGPDFVSRRMDYVSGVINETKKSPFAKIKSMSADITTDEARAKGYVTGAEKTEEVFALLSRETSPTTIYKKQKLDRDDIVDITDMNVVAWLKNEMRVMLDEEIARAVLVGDGRAVEDADKIKEDKIRPIYTDADFYAHKIKIAADALVLAKIEAIIRARKFYKGKGTPKYYTTTDELNDMLLAKDTQNRRLYSGMAELKAQLRVKEIVEVEVMEGIERNDGVDDVILCGIMVNLNDYTVGSNKGGEVNMFDDFDIDYNQLKYLIETRMSGALIHPKSALIIEQIKTVG